MATTAYPKKASASGGLPRLAHVATHLTCDRLRLFASAWALATLFHVVGEPQKLFTLTGGPADFTSSTSFFHAALIFAAVYVLINLGDRLRLLVLALIQVLDYTTNSPIASNDWTLAFYTSIGITVSGMLLLFS